MKKLDALIAGFADEVFRTIRGATLEELAELLGSPMPAEPSRRSAARVARGGAAPRWSPPGRSRWRTERSSRADEREERDEREDASVPPDAPVVAEITDPERLLRVESDASLPRPRAEPPSRQEPSPEPPPVSTEKPVSAPPVLLRANEALVRASGAGIVIRRRKEA